MKVLSVVGARPQFIKAAPVSRVLRDRHEEILVHTGQHYDDSMSGTFFRELAIPEPDVNLDVGSATHAVMTAEIMRRLEPVVLEHEPDGVLLYGDTNSTVAAALVAAKMTYPRRPRPWVAHVEGGLRAFNRQWPEEHNRIVSDHLSDLVLAPTTTAMDNLAREGLAERSVLTGDVMAEAFEWAVSRVGPHLPAAAAEAPGYALLTMHRGDHVDDPVVLTRWMAVLEMDRPVVFPVHPRTAATLRAARIGIPSNVRAIEPVGYLAMIALETHASLIMTDSGGVQREAYLAGVPCYTLRDETEWLETLEGGWNRLVGSDPDGLRRALAEPIPRPTTPRRPVFGDGRVAARIVEAMEALAAARQAAEPMPATGSPAAV